MRKLCRHYCTGNYGKVDPLLITEFLPATGQNIDHAACILKNLGLVAFPTDTVYGVGASAFSEEAVDRLYAAKGRPREKAFQLLLEKFADVRQVAQNIPPAFDRLAARFFPGGLTVVLIKSPLVPASVTSGKGTVAVRIPDHPVTMELIRKLGSPLAATSANLSGQPSPLTAEGVRSQLGGRIDVILDGGPCPGGVESTVIDLTVDPPKILRQGAIPRRLIEEELQSIIT